MKAVLVDIGWRLTEEVLGAIQYNDGRYLVLLNHVSPENQKEHGFEPSPVAFITDRSDPSKFAWVWSMPGKLRDFTLNGEIGESGKVSNRRVTVVDPAEAIPSGEVVITRDTGNWVGY